MASNIQASGSFKRIFNSSSSGQSQETMTQNRQRQEIVKCGWLFKQGGVIKSWHRRWFIIRGDQLFYYTSQDESKQMGSIFLPGNKVVETPLNPNEPEKFPFEIQPGSEKSRVTLTHETYPLQAASEEDRKYWIQAIKKVMFGERGGAIFGQKLAETMAYEARTSNRKVPRIVEMCVEFLLKNAVEMEGIFRLAGRSILIKQLKETFDSGENIEFVMPEIDVHSVASLLKLYLRELPEPIVPRQFYEPVMKIVQRDMHVNPDKAMNSLQALLTHIPKCNYNLIQYLTHFLHEVSSKSYVNKMTSMNLATVFVHCMIRPEDEDPALLMGTANGRTQVTFIFITEWEKLFKMEYNALGAAVKVGTLLDIDVSSEGGKTFNPDTSTPVGKTELSASNELLDLALVSDQADVPEPALVPATNSAKVSSPAEDHTSTDKAVERRASDHGYSTIDDERLTDTNTNLYATINDLDPYSTVKEDTDSSEVQSIPVERSQPPIPARPAPPPPRSVSNDEISSASKEPTSPPKVLMRSKSGSIPKPRPRKISGASLGKEIEQIENQKKQGAGDSNGVSAPPPTPPKPKSASFSGPHTSGMKSTPEKPVPIRPAPPPPVKVSNSCENHHYDEIEDVTGKASSTFVSTPSVSNTDSYDMRDSTVSVGEMEDNENLNQLINTDTEEFTNSDLQSFISRLKSELLSQRNKAKERHSKLCQKHMQQLKDMAKKVDQEKIATANAVEKIISLKSELQAYSMKYGCVD